MGLRAFSAAYRLRKLSTAADSLNITQSAVSGQLECRLHPSPSTQEALSKQALFFCNETYH
jgi:hypothetical protein